MNRYQKIALFPLLIITGALLIALALGYIGLARSLPVLDGEQTVVNLSKPAEVVQDRFGIPSVNANTRLDAARIIGYLTARDRLFQMDLMRRKTGGRLAEIFGEIALPSDSRARILGYARIARQIVLKLSDSERRYLKAYAVGVNSYLQQARALPFEFALLRYRPEAWTMQDSLLVVLGMFDTLTGHAEDSERMLTIMAETLPAEVVRFLTPDIDPYTDALLHNTPSARPEQPVPTAAMSQLLAGQEKSSRHLAAADSLETLAGSNAWAVAGSKTSDGRAILANDMHLSLSVPNIWYRVEVHYPKVDAAGVLLPGTPFIVAGSNRHIAWGMTNLSGDFIDLVQLELNPSNPKQYRLGANWQDFGERQEKIAIKGGIVKTITVRETVWGPVSDELLLGRPVAVHWVALDADAVDLKIADLERTTSLTAAVNLAKQAGGPQLNVVLADDQGQIAWTITGKIPRRFGNDGLISRSWANNKIGWQGYVEPAKLPDVIDPPEGYVVSANDRRLGYDAPLHIGHQFANGFRAYRISQRLQQESRSSEGSLFNLQQDTETDFYRYYQQLALQVLTAGVIAQQPELADVRNYLLSWNGRADTTSLGLPVLIEFRRQLIDAIFTPFLSPCLQADKNFVYAWTYVDTPLQKILNEQPAALLPASEDRNWQQFIVSRLAFAAKAVKDRHAETAWADLTWGRENKIGHAHPFSRAMPFLSMLLDRPPMPVAGCGGYCVRVAGAHFGASERLVVSPNHLEDGILHMPGGQSGHPLSPFYDDQQAYWLKGLPLPLLAGKAEHKLKLVQ
jgi:penicillin amidase